MKIILHEKDKYLLRFDFGEDVIAELKKFFEQNKIGAAALQGVGATDDLLLSYYNGETKEFEDHEYSEDMEITSLMGNVSQFKSETIIHLHGTFGTQTMRAIAGHVKKLVVSVTCEMAVTVFEGKAERAHDNRTNLNLLK